MNDIITQWEAGDLSDERAAYALAQYLGEIDDTIAPLSAEKEQVRNVLSRIVGRLGNKHTIPGFGELVNTAPSVTATFDAKAIESLIVDMTAAEGMSEWAQRLARCKKQSSRAGSLRITREKSK